MNLSWLKPTEKKIFFIIVFTVWELFSIAFYKGNILPLKKLLLIVPFIFLSQYLLVSIIILYAEKYSKAVKKSKVKETKFSLLKGILQVLGLLIFIIIWTTIILSQFVPYFEKFGKFGILLEFIFAIAPFALLLYYAFRNV